MSDPRPPKSPRKGKYVNIRIVFLNDTVHVFQVPVKGAGALLWKAVTDHLQLLEADYFDLEYTNTHGDECWLDKDKTVLKQIGSADTPLRFCVKFYTPDPGLLEDELTRYLFALQVRKDLLLGELRCSENTAALLASYVVQAELGDFDLEEYPEATYLAGFKFVPEHLQSHEFMAKVMDYHKQHIGESPSEADLNLLDTARKVELYGVKMQSAKDHEGVSLNLAVAHLGVLVFQQFTKINTFSWAKVRKLSFKRKKFLIKLHADTYDRRLGDVSSTPTKSGRGYYKDTVEFFFETRDRCKLFWKRCIEHHAFFRCQVVAKMPRNKTRVVSRGSSFRYSGKTQKQLVEYVRENMGKRPQFERTSTSGRISSRSTSVTPKISSKPGMHSSSADLHTSSGSRSSGSHILDSNHTALAGSRDASGTPQGAVRVESVDVHSDSSMSGSRSLNSPRLEHGLSIDQDVIEAVNARTEGMTDEDEEDNNEDDHRHAAEVKDMDTTDDRGGGRNNAMAHVASETKGAHHHSLLSPESSSPVRYVGLYSEVGSPELSGEGGLTSPEDSLSRRDKAAATRNRAATPSEISKSDDAKTSVVGRGTDASVVACSSNREAAAGGGSGEGVPLSPSVSCGVGSAVVSVDSNHHQQQQHHAATAPRDNLDLRLASAGSTSASPPAAVSPSSAVTSSVQLLSQHKSLPSPPPPAPPPHPSLQSPSSSSPSSSFPPHTVTTTTSSIAVTSSLRSSSSSSPSSHLPLSVSSSASQNANDVCSEKSPHPVQPAKVKSNVSHSQVLGSCSPSSSSGSSSNTASSKPQNFSSELNVSDGMISHHDASTTTTTAAAAATTAKVRSSDSIQQQQKTTMMLPRVRSAGGSEKEVAELSPPFPSPPPPLSPQYSEEEMKRSLDASPSSCVTATAFSRHHQQQHQVRLASSSSSSSKLPPSLDSSRSSPPVDLTPDRCSGSSSTASPVTVLPERRDGRATPVTPSSSSPPTLERAASAADVCDKGGKSSSGKGAVGKKSHKKDSKPPKGKKSAPEAKKMMGNGQLVGAGLPERRSAEGDPASRKLSAGTDLIEDIPYILHRRLDGQKEETALFKVSETDKTKKQKQQSCSENKRATTGASATPRPARQNSPSSEVIEKLRSDCRSMSPQSRSNSRSASPASTPGAAGAGVGSTGRSKGSSLERSPPLNRRLEFVSVHKLPSRTSYSSVDDTTSPSADAGIFMSPRSETPAKLPESEVAGEPAEKAEAEGDNRETETRQEVRQEASRPEASQSESKKEEEKQEETSTAPGHTSEVGPDSEVTNRSSNGQEAASTSESSASVGEKKESKDALSKHSTTNDSTALDDVQFYSPKVPGGRKFQQSIPVRTSTSDESPDCSVPTSRPQGSASPSTSSENVSDMVLEPLQSAPSKEPSSQHQYFEVSKPQPCHSKDPSSPSTTADSAFSPPPPPSSSTPKDVPKSLPLKPNQPAEETSDLPLNTFGKPQSPSFPTPPPVVAPKPSQTSHPAQQQAAEKTASQNGKSPSSSSMETNNQFLIDLPSPAAALFYSDNDSPPPTQRDGTESTSTLKFSTFRPPDSGEEVVVRAEEMAGDMQNMNRWSLHSVSEPTEASDYLVIMTEGVVEKSALKKRTNEDPDKPREPKRVSWHEDSDIQHSYHSDLSMTAQRSPVDEYDPTLFGDAATPVDSGNILETLENLRQQNSESDMTYSGESMSSSEQSDGGGEAENSSKQVYFQYAAAKGLTLPSKEGTLDSGVGGLSEGGRSQDHESSPLESLEGLGAMGGSGGSFGDRRFPLQGYGHHADSSPLEPLERLSMLGIDDNFDDEGEADDEDDEPNFPPPPPILDIPEEMLVSCESDLPLPDIKFPSCEGLDSYPRKFPGAHSSVAASLSSGGRKVGPSRSQHKRPSSDPLAALESGDLVGDMQVTTSESESDFDEEQANLDIRRMSVGVSEKDSVSMAQASSSSTFAKTPTAAAAAEGQGSSSDEGPMAVRGRVSVAKLVHSHQGRQQQQQRTSVDGRQPPPHPHHPSSSPQGSGQQPPRPHIVHKSHPGPPPLHPKPKVGPPVPPKQMPIRQPQMGKGKHFERTRQKSSSPSSSSSSSSSDVKPLQQHPPNS